MENMPFKESIINSVNHRYFDSNSELKWHWDKEDRWVWVDTETNWEIQLDNELPQQIPNNYAIFVPKHQWHRLIKGSNESCLIKVKKWI